MHLTGKSGDEVFSVVHQFYRDMVKAYTELFPDIRFAFAPESENAYRVWGTHDRSSFCWR
ncbi:MAG: hypothetical protein ACLTX3_07965 [Lachnospiraceae bacterium]